MAHFLPQAVTLSAYYQDVLKKAGDGSGILFFSGGSALAATSRTLAKYEIPSTHIITPFDSGGSSAKLRAAFNMPAVGDIRNRLLCLARLGVVGQALPELCSMRLGKSDNINSLKQELALLARGEHAAMRKLSGDDRYNVIKSFAKVLKELPSNFDLHGASIGNLLLTGVYLRCGGDFAHAVEEFSLFLDIVGTVQPVVTESVHLGAILEDGSMIVGQHLITGKEAPPLLSPIKELFLAPYTPAPQSLSKERVAEQPEKADVFIKKGVEKRIENAAAVCFPMGSFYSSILANLLPHGVGRAIAKTACPKIYIPNLGEDPEAKGLSVADLAQKIIAAMQKDCCSKPVTAPLLSHVLLDESENYLYGVEEEKLEKMGIAVVKFPLIDRSLSLNEYSPVLLLSALAEIVAIEG